MECPHIRALARARDRLCCRVAPSFCGCICTCICPCHATVRCRPRQVEVNTPEEHMGDVIGDLNSRRGMVGEFIDKPANMKLIKVS
jgi:hypothetical protein